MKELKQAIKYYWIKTLKSNSRVLSIIVQLNYIALVSLSILGKFEFNWNYLAFYIITMISLCVLVGLIQFNKVNTTIDVELGK